MIHLLDSIVAVHYNFRPVILVTDAHPASKTTDQMEYIQAKFKRKKPLCGPVHVPGISCELSTSQFAVPRQGLHMPQGDAPHRPWTPARSLFQYSVLTPKPVLYAHYPTMFGLRTSTSVSTQETFRMRPVAPVRSSVTVSMHHMARSTPQPFHGSFKPGNMRASTLPKMFDFGHSLNGRQGHTTSTMAPFPGGRTPETPDPGEEVCIMWAKCKKRKWNTPNHKKRLSNMPRHLLK